ncbi:hypothetical protein [Streptomyces alboflavus]|uniref:hypothetical protein n=1 Tax=Streptomyces alboflavus TaxID=67267 RepID=UPI0012FE8EC3|nr:hypothetical protein [Streptomyces alboflavus]
MSADEWAVFLQALADHFGEDAAVDWAIASLELAAKHLNAPADNNAPPHHGGHT